MTLSGPHSRGAAGASASPSGVLGFVRAIEAALPANLDVHLVDNRSTHKDPRAGILSRRIVELRKLRLHDFCR